MNKKLLENDQLPIEDKELFERMRLESCSDNERVFFEKMEYKELYEYPISSFDVILSELDNDEGIFFVKCYTSEYLIGKKAKDLVKKLKDVPTSLSDALNEDLFILLGKHITLWEWLRMRDFSNLNYNYEWEE